MGVVHWQPLKQALCAHRRKITLVSDYIEYFQHIVELIREDLSVQGFNASSFVYTEKRYEKYRMKEYELEMVVDEIVRHDASVSNSQVALSLDNVHELMKSKEEHWTQVDIIFRNDKVKIELSRHELPEPW
ncbi:hypothetical protein [Vibrio coralliilyticus]|uniref:hypothetical protein n=1 Tax=Vibrio coralliilyticus TaxID=190893 RepID=UPI001560323E|nr:hypothetical protein [Vibrio coralliilyticus]NRF17433.1 hypothetical protein [Vibrio coralliilyticus]